MPHPNITAVWPPSGIALAAVLLCGYRLLPGVALGAFLAHATTSVSLVATSAITAGNTLEVFIAVSLLNRLVRFQPCLARLWDILALFGAALASTALAATVGTLSLWVSGSLAGSACGWAWSTWWAGEALGIIIVTPLILVWASGERPTLSPRWLGEGLLLLCALVTINMIVFHGAFVRAESHYPLTFLSISAMVWVALRLSRRVAVAALFVASVVAILGTTHGLGPFAKEATAVRLLLLGTAIIVMAHSLNLAVTA